MKVVTLNMIAKRRWCWEVFGVPTTIGKGLLDNLGL